MTIRPGLVPLLGVVLLSGCVAEPGYYPTYSSPYYAPYYDYGGSELWFGGGYWGRDHNWHRGRDRDHGDHDRGDHGRGDHDHGDHGGPRHEGGRK